MQNKKGFSITEVVIAMVIIAIVSVSALSAVIGSVNAKAAAANRTAAQDFAANALECYKATSNPNDFYTYLHTIYTEVKQSGNETEQKCTYAGTGWQAEMTVSATDFHIEITDDDGNTIVKYDYEKYKKPLEASGNETEGSE